MSSDSPLPSLGCSTCARASSIDHIGTRMLGWSSYGFELRKEVRHLRYLPALKASVQKTDVTFPVIAIVDPRETAISAFAPCSASSEVHNERFGVIGPDGVQRVEGSIVRKQLHVWVKTDLSVLDTTV